MKVITVVLQLITVAAQLKANLNFLNNQKCTKEVKNEFFHRDKKVLEFHANFKKAKTASIRQLLFFQ
jgi:hypothetical protein